MAITIISRKIKDRLKPSTSVHWSLFAIGEPLTIEIIFECFTQISFTVNSPLTTQTPVFQNQLFNNSGRFAPLNIGDTINIVGTGYFATNNKFTVVNKFTNNNILLSNCLTTGNPLPNNYSDFDMIINNLSIITGVSMPYGFIENNEPINFLSKVDGQFQSLTSLNIPASGTTPVNMVFNGLPPYQIGSATIERVATDLTTGRQSFKIIHETSVLPIFLATQLSDLQNIIAPNYYLNNKCLRHVYQIRAAAQFQNPNSNQSTDCPSEIGNSGWFNEVFNGGTQDIFITNVAFSYGGVPKTSLILTSLSGIQLVEFDIEATNVTFTDITRLLLGLCKIPNLESEYQTNGRDFQTNFVFKNEAGQSDSVWKYPVDSGTASGTIYRWKVDIINDYKLHVSMEVLIGSDAYLIFKESQTPRFLFWVTIADLSSYAGDQNKQAIITQPYEFDTTPNPADYNNYIYLFRHWEDETDSGSVLPTTFKNDECVMRSRIIGSFSPIPNPDIIDITEFRQQIVAKRISDGAEFLLESWNLPVNMIYIAGQPVMNFSTPRIFQIPTGEIRKNITIETVFIGGGTEFYVNYPFMIRWEYWIQLIGVNTDFFNTSQPNNGSNQDWFHYITADWEIYLRSGVSGIVDGQQWQQDDDLLLNINDYASNPDYTTKQVESFTLSGTPLSAGGVNYIQAFAPTLIRATFERTTPLNIADAVVVFGIEVYEQGGIGGRKRYSSKWETPTPLTLFTPISGINDKIILTQVNATTIKAEAVIDNTLLPTGNINYTIVARIYDAEYIPNPEFDKTMTDGTFKTTTDGNIKSIA